MRRRDFLTALGVTATAWPRTGWAQMSKKMARIGVLWHAGSAEEEAVFLNPLVEGIASLGWVEGQNVVFEHRFPAEQPERFKALAGELARLDLDLIIASASNAAFAAKEATKTIPIVFIFVADPVETGLVDSLAHPGGNLVLPWWISARSVWKCSRRHFLRCRRRCCFSMVTIKQPESVSLKGCARLPIS